MDRERAVNKVLRDMKQWGLIASDEEGEVRSGDARFFLNALWVASYEGAIKQNSTRHTRKITEFDREGNELQGFNSVIEASKTLSIPRSTIGYTLFGKTKRMRNGHYFRYTEEGNNSESEEAE